MIKPTNKRLKTFHLIVSLTLYFDFFMTCMVIGNYRFFYGLDEPEFLSHQDLFNVIIVIEAIDTFLTFFKIQIGEAVWIEDPIVVAKSYLLGDFIFDAVSLLPWTIIDRRYTFLRFLKLRKLTDY